MQQLGIYEQLITQLINSQLDRDHFYVGERELTNAEATVWLSRFLTHILEFAIGAVPSGEDQLQKQIELSNQLILWFKDQVGDDGFFEDNLLHSQGKILTALYDLGNPVAAERNLNIYLYVNVLIYLNFFLCLLSPSWFDGQFYLLSNPVQPLLEINCKPN